MSTRILLIAGACIVVVIATYYLMRNVSMSNISSVNITNEIVEKLTDKNTVQDTLYFMSKDISGTKSMIHDSGIKPSVLKSERPENVLMKIVKYEYNDGIEKILGRPVELAIGQNIYHLVTNIKLAKSQVQEKRDHYIVTIDNLWK